MYSMDPLDKQAGWHEIAPATQNRAQCKTYGLFISGMFHLVFSYRGWPWGNETMGSETVDQGGRRNFNSLYVIVHYVHSHLSSEQLVYLSLNNVFPSYNGFQKEPSAQSCSPWAETSQLACDQTVSGLPLIYFSALIFFYSNMSMLYNLCTVIPLSWVYLLSCI